MSRPRYRYGAPIDGNVVHLRAADRRGERVHRRVEIGDDERLLEEPRAHVGEQRIHRAGHARGA